MVAPPPLPPSLSPVPPLGVSGTHLYGGVNGPEVNGLEDVAVQRGRLVRLEGQTHLDERVRESLWTLTTITWRQKKERARDRERYERYYVRKQVEKPSMGHGGALHNGVFSVW